MRLARPPEPADQARVRVTFLRMAEPPPDPPPALPAGARIERVARPTVAFYRYLYDTVGGPYLWWLRRATTDSDLASLLAHPGLSLHVLYHQGAPAGFHELEWRPGPVINLNYFGLLPHALGQGLGRAFLRHAIDTGWAARPTALSVNTCNADHPRALPLYRATGFHPVRVLEESWSIPRRLGFTIPPALRP